MEEPEGRIGALLNRAGEKSLQKKKGDKKSGIIYKPLIWNNYPNQLFNIYYCFFFKLQFMHQMKASFLQKFSYPVSS